MQIVYLVVTQSGTGFSKFISHFTGNAPYAHAGLSYDKSLNPMYSFGRKFTYTLYPSGFITKGFGTHFYNHHPNGRMLVYKLELTGQQADIFAKRLAPFLEKPKWYKYGMINCFAYYLGKPSHRVRHYTCVGFVADMIDGFVHFDKDTSLVNAMDMCALGLPLLYEGSFKDFSADALKDK
ncbi:MAG: hypothetical protein RSE10_02025 [Oscillospiraceae bacterium]